MQLCPGILLQHWTLNKQTNDSPTDPPTGRKSQLSHTHTHTHSHTHSFCVVELLLLNRDCEKPCYAKLRCNGFEFLFLIKSKRVILNKVGNILCKPEVSHPIGLIILYYSIVYYHKYK